MKSNGWHRVRFYCDVEDFRPVKWPPPGPFLCSGESDRGYVLIAYVKLKKQVKEFWPE